MPILRTLRRRTETEKSESREENKSRLLIMCIELHLAGFGVAWHS